METNQELYPKTLDPSTTEFVANGVKYYVEREGKLSIIRDRFLEKFSLYSLLGRNASVLLKELKEVYNSINAGKMADAAVKVNDLIKAAVEIDTKHGPLLYVCTLFINREGEDRRSYELEDAKRKLADWEAEGIDSGFFLGLALSFLTSTAENWSELIQTFSSASLVSLSDLTKNLSPLSDKPSTETPTGLTF